jgi:hypothetical protein
MSLISLSTLFVLHIPTGTNIRISPEIEVDNVLNFLFQSTIMEDTHLNVNKQSLNICGPHGSDYEEYWMPCTLVDNDQHFRGCTAFIFRVGLYAMHSTDIVEGSIFSLLHFIILLPYAVL